MKDDKWGFINASGKEVITLNFTDANDFNEGVASVKRDGKWGFIDHKGKLVIPAKYAAACDFSSDRALVVFPNTNCQWLPSLLRTWP